MTLKFTCKVCGKPAQQTPQGSLIPGRAPIIQVDCRTPGCKNHLMTAYYREGDADAEQQTGLYYEVTKA